MMSWWLCGLGRCGRPSAAETDKDGVTGEASSASSATSLDRIASFQSAVSCDDAARRRQSFYGNRQRIPTRVDILRHPSGEWWSDARIDAPHVAADLGPEPKVLGRTFKVKVIDRDHKCANEIEYFKDCAEAIRPERRYIVTQLLLGERIVVSIADVFDTDTFDDIFATAPSSEALPKSLKLIVNPANVRIPWSITGPKDSSSISDFFGDANCSIRLKTSDKVRFVAITIDVYSKFMIRSFLPKLAFQPGRVSDYMIVDYERRMVTTGFRLVCTSTLKELMAGSANHPRAR